MGNPEIITIDGPSGAGKGTISKAVAQKLGFHYLDSGALYRIIAHVSANQGIQPNDEAQLVALATTVDIHFEVETSPLTREIMTHVFADGKDVTQAIYTEECGQRASIVAALPLLRTALLEMQRGFAKAPGLVADGRDMGTVVFPQAKTKVFLTASVEERAKRRYLQLKDQDSSVTIEKICDSLTERDRRDSSRDAAPLKAAVDAEVIDTSALAIPEVIAQVMERLH